nr:MAG TPA: hypothetical protein [Caudoviricetes sp.]
MSIKGIDISVYQRGMKLSKNNGYDFVILRGGFTGYGTGVSLNKDNCFEDFYKQCKSNNIPVGAYWYSCANTYQKGVNEANYMYENCLKGKQFEYPIYIDVEDSHHQIKSKTGTTDAIIGFCETLENKGYYVGIYANTDWFKNHIETNRLNAYDKWIAQWSNQSPTFISYGLWQNSSSGNVSGFRVDTDISYKDYPSIIKSNNLNGFSGSNNTSNDTPSKKSNEEIAKEVINGLWGNGQDRKNKLEANGYNYYEIQNIVNNMLKNTTSKTLTIGTKVKTISGGNGASDGSSKVAMSGIIGNISAIINGAKYPYLVSRNGTPIGWYKKDALQIL